MSAALRFCGRSDELDTLIERWRLASDLERPSPQVVVIKAERGVGKTRLVLEFYRWLSEHADATDYWPDAPAIIGRNLNVNPEVSNCDFRVPIPYLWWGVRGCDPGQENSAAGDAIATHDRYLAPHLVSLEVRARQDETGLSIGRVWLDVGVDIAANVLKADTVLSVGKGLFETIDILRGAVGQVRYDEARDRPRSRAEAVVADFAKVFSRKSRSSAKTPAVIFIDDAQFASQDPALLAFADRLIHAAVTQQWPMMIIATHWRKEFSEETDSSAFAGIIRHGRGGGVPGVRSVAGLPGILLDDGNYCEIDLRVVEDLSDALSDRLPGLTETQASAILGRVGGNPRFLEQIIRFFLERGRYFEGKDVTRALTTEGLNEALERAPAIFDVVLERLNESPRDVQEAICLASMQGMQFSGSIAEDFAQAAMNRSVREPLARAENPYSMVTGHGPSEARAVWEFAERLFYEVAAEHRKSMPSLHDEAVLWATLKRVLSARLDERSFKSDVLAPEDHSLTYRIAATVFERSNDVLDKIKALVALDNLAVLQVSQHQFEQSESTRRRLANLLVVAPEALRLAPDSIIESASDHSDPGDAGSPEEWRHALAIAREYLNRQRTRATQVNTEEAWLDCANALRSVAFAEVGAEPENLETPKRLSQECLAISQMMVDRFHTSAAMASLLSSLSYVHEFAATDRSARAELYEKELDVARAMEEQFPKDGFYEVTNVLLRLLTSAYRDLHDVARAMKYLPELETRIARLERDGFFVPSWFAEFSDIQRELRETAG